MTGTARNRASIQCSTGPLWAMELERAMDLIADAGFTEIELMVTRDPRTHHAHIPQRLADERGLRIASVHGPFLILTRSVWTTDPIEKIRRGIDLCAAVGADTLIVHPPYLWEGRYAAWLTEEGLEVSEATGVAIAVETMYPRWVGRRRLRGHRWLTPDELDAAPYVALDTSHVTLARHDVLDAYATLSSKIVHIHLSDNAGNGRDGHLELGQGVLPIETFLTELRRTKYSGAVSLELSSTRYVERPRELVRMLKRNREYVERTLFSRGRVRSQRRVERGAMEQA